MVSDEALGRWLILVGVHPHHVVPADAAPVRALGASLRGADAAGRVLAMKGTHFVAPVPNVVHAESLLVLVADVGFARVDTVVRLRGIGAKLRQFRFADTLGTNLAANPLLVPPQPVLLPRGAIAIVHASPYCVEVRDASGAVRVGPDLGPDAGPPTESDKRRAIIARWQGLALARTLPTSTFDDRPLRTPAFLDGAVTMTAGGCIVVRRFVGNPTAPAVVDVLDAAGALRVRLRLAPGETLVRVGAFGVYVTRPDSDGLLSIGRYPPLRLAC